MIELEGNPIILVLVTAIPGALSIASGCLDIGYYFQVQRSISILFRVVMFFVLGVIMLVFTMAGGSNPSIDVAKLVPVVIVGWFIFTLAMLGYFVFRLIELVKVMLIRSKKKKRGLLED